MNDSCKNLKEIRLNALNTMSLYVERFAFVFGEYPYIWNSSKAEEEYNKLSRIVVNINNDIKMFDQIQDHNNQ